MTFSQKAEEVRRKNPSWDYSRCCAELGRRGAAKRKARSNKAQPGVYWWNKEIENTSLTSTAE